MKKATWKPGDKLPGVRSDQHLSGRQPMAQTKPDNGIEYAGSRWSPNDQPKDPGKWSWLR